MSAKKIKIATISIVILASSCNIVNIPLKTPYSTEIISNTISPSTSTPFAEKNRGREILDKIQRMANDYNQFIVNEKQTGNFEIITFPDGNEGFGFTNSSYIKVFNEYTAIQNIIGQLNDEYYNLYMEDKEPAQIPTLSNQGDQKDILEKLLNENLRWLKEEFQTGTTVSIYSPIELAYLPILMGDSYVHEKEKEAEIATLKISLNKLSQRLIDLDIQQIQNIEPGNVSFIDIGAFPYYRSDIKLTTYETGTTIYNVYSQTHQIIEILPKQLPDAAASSSLPDLEKTAREMIAKISPDVNLDNLTPAGGAKVGTYFFRWEDRTKPLLDDGKSYPFIQVGLNGNGELLNYYNTLPLAR